MLCWSFFQRRGRYSLDSEEAAISKMADNDSSFSHQSWTDVRNCIAFNWLPWKLSAKKLQEFVLVCGWIKQLGSNIVHKSDHTASNVKENQRPFSSTTVSNSSKRQDSFGSIDHHSYVKGQTVHEWYELIATSCCFWCL